MNKQELSAEARKRVGAGALLLDVRTPDEFKQGHVEGAVNIPLQELPQRVKEVGAPSRSVVVYCQAGMRAAKAEAFLRQQGFSDVFNLLSVNNW